MVVTMIPFPSNLFFLIGHSSYSADRSRPWLVQIDTSQKISERRKFEHRLQVFNIGISKGGKGGRWREKEEEKEKEENEVESGEGGEKIEEDRGFGFIFQNGIEKQRQGGYL